MSKFLHKWSLLKHRERSMIVYGLFFILLATLYFYVWQPYNQSINNMRQEIMQKEDDFLWLEEMALQIKKMYSLEKTSRGSFSGALINIVDKSIKQKKLNKYVNLLENTSNNKIAIQFNAITFKELIVFVAFVKQRYGILIDSISIKKNADNVHVNSRVILKES